MYNMYRVTVKKCSEKKLFFYKMYLQKTLVTLYIFSFGEIITY